MKAEIDWMPRPVSWSMLNKYKILQEKNSWDHFFAQYKQFSKKGDILHPGAVCINRPS